MYMYMYVHIHKNMHILYIQMYNMQYIFTQNSCPGISCFHNFFRIASVCTSAVHTHWLTYKACTHDIRAAHVNVADVSIGERHGAISEGPLLLTERAKDHDAVGRSGGSQQETEVTQVKEAPPTQQVYTCT